MFLTPSVFFLAHEYSTIRRPHQTAIASEASKSMTTMDVQTLNITTEEMLVETPSATKLVPSTTKLVNNTTMINVFNKLMNSIAEQFTMVQTNMERFAEQVSTMEKAIDYSVCYCQS